MRILAGLAFAALVLGACDSKPEEQAVAPTAETPSPVPETAMNTLTAEETAAGWKLLFNGTDLTGWKGYKKDAPGEAWKVEDGTIALTAGGAGDLMSAEEFGPFELSLEWKIAPNGNSGIIYLVNEVDGADNTYNTGPEMQVLDNDGHPDGKLRSHRAGALYDLQEPQQDAAKPVGEWNEARIVYTGSKIEHWLNGVKMAETSYGDDVWKQTVAGSKFKQWPMFGTFAKGHIALQDHGDQVWYRNIKIKPL